MSEASEDDIRWLDAAVRFARPHLGTTGGHPTVAALVVDPETGRVHSRAVTGAGGVPTAVVAALTDAGMSADGSTLYVTLEPTLDEAQMIVASGIERVVVGVRAPGSEAGRGVLARLAEDGITVALGDHGPSTELHAANRHRIVAGRPLTTLRLAVSADGMIGRKDGVPMDLIGPATRDWLGMQRALSDAVMIGARTAELDDPTLEPGLNGLEDRRYARVVVVGTRAPPTGLRLLRGNYPVLVLCERGKDFGLPPPVEFITLEGKNGRPDLRKGMAALAARNVSSLFVEGGAKLTEAMLSAELVDHFQLIETTVEVGRAGLPATGLGTIHGRLKAAGFVETASRAVGPDRLRTYERRI